MPERFDRGPPRGGMTAAVTTASPGRTFPALGAGLLLAFALWRWYLHA